MDQRAAPQSQAAGASPWNPRDASHLRAVCALRPEIDTQLGGTLEAGELGSLSADARTALFDVLNQWRLDLETQIEDSRERTLDVRVFAASLEFFRFCNERIALHERDPDAGSQLVETLVYHLRGHADGEQERFSTLARRLSKVAVHLESARPCITHPCADLVARAAEVMHGAPDLLQAIADAARQAQAAGLIPDALVSDVHHAVDTALKAVDEQSQWLKSLAAEPWQPMPVPVFDEMLRLRGLDLTSSEVLDLSKAISEEFRIEATRAAQRSLKRGSPEMSVDQVIDAERSATAPQSLGEAIAWLGDLTVATRAFLAERGSVPLPQAGNERIVVEAMPTVLAPLGHAILHVAPQPLAPTQESLLLVREPLDQPDNALHGLSVADLENNAAALGYPGRHLQCVWTNQSTSVARRGVLLGGLGTVASTWGQDMVFGWSSICEELMRELQFRSSPASRLVMLRRGLISSLLATTDVCLAIGRMNPVEAAAFLVRQGGLRPIVAQALVRSLLRAPSQGLSSLVGKVRIEQLRREARKAWREKFSDARFFQFILTSGPVPLAYLFERLSDPLSP